MPTPYQCEVCGKPVDDYEPTFCCDGRECSCQGKPTEPCLCSKECENALFRGIGKTLEERRLDANILPYNFHGGDIHEYLRLSGYTDGDTVKDLGDKLVGTKYFVRQRVGVYEYVLLSFYRDQFCEGVYWVYAAPRNDRLKSNNTFDAMKKGGVPVVATLFRDLADFTCLELADEYLSTNVATTLRNLEQKCKRK